MRDAEDAQIELDNKTFGGRTLEVCHMHLHGHPKADVVFGIYTYLVCHRHARQSFLKFSLSRSSGHEMIAKPHER